MANRHNRLEERRATVLGCLGLVPHLQRSSVSGRPDAFCGEKEPKNKGEELAVAARYRELRENAQTHSKKDLQKVVLDARRHFDAGNFNRDIENVRRQAGLFNTGTGEKDSFTLSYYGQQYVDALPDRAKVKTLRRPKRTGGKRPRVKKAK